jgi:hypothetical protein
MKIKVKGKVIGELLESGVFVKRVRKSLHLFRKFNAWGIDGNVFTNKLKPINAKIVIYDEEEDIRYETTAKHFEAKGQWMHFKKDTADHYAQIFLPLDEFICPKRVKSNAVDANGMSEKDRMIMESTK